MARILVVDDEEDVRTFIAECLEYEGHNVAQADCGESALDAVRSATFDLVITDLRMPGMGGLELLAVLRAEQPEVEVVMVTAHGNVDNAVNAMKQGAFDFVQKPLSSPGEIRLLAQRALEHRTMKAIVENVGRHEKKLSLGYGDPAMAPVSDALRKVAKTDATVLLIGESGVGKEVAAQVVHDSSQRASGPFVIVNCATLSENLLESELFGHERGAFTGATTRKRGRIELAHGGTFFLDEIGELRLDLQAKLLRVVQERVFERVGGTRSIEVDVRWIAATNRNLHQMMSEGLFREDLYHRIAVFPLSLPPLRERRLDIAPLSDALLEQIRSELKRPQLVLSAKARDFLQKAQWPGNVRELRNVLERGAILADGPSIDVEHLYIHGMPSSKVGKPFNSADQTLEELERSAIESALAGAGGIRKAAAANLGIPLRTLYDKLKRHGIS